MAIVVAEGISGSLQETALTDLLRILAWNGRTGTLLLWSERKQIGLVFEQGRIVRAFSTEPLETVLTKALVVAGKVNGRQIERARAAFRGVRGREWRTLRLLAADGEVRTDGMVCAHETAVNELLRMALPWASGQLQFKPDVPALWPEGLARLNVEEALINGLREIDERSQPVATPHTLVRWAPAAPPALTASIIGPARWAVLDACNGKRTLGEIADMLGRDVETLTEQVQWLLDHDAVVLVAPAPVAPEPDTDVTPIEDRFVLLLSLFESSWPGDRAPRSKQVAALTKMINSTSQLYLEYWKDLVVPDAFEHVWQGVMLPRLESVLADGEASRALGLIPDRNSLRDGQLLTQKMMVNAQGAVEAEPVPTLRALLRLLESGLLLVVSEIERPIAFVDSFESANVFIREFDQRLTGAG